MKTDDAKAYAADSAEWSKLLRDKQTAQITANAAIQAINDKAATASAKLWDKAFATLGHTFDSAIRGMVTGTQSFKGAFASMIQDMTAKFISAMVTQAAQYIAAHLLMLAVHKSIHQQEVLADAKSAAAAAWKAVVGIPVIGPVLAPIAAATAFAGVEAFSAERGWDMVPAGGALTRLHAREMVLSAPIADAVRGRASGGSSSAGGEIHIHYSPQIHAIDARGVAGLLDKHSSDIVAAIQKERRQFRI
jgi:hypothetical protein